MLFMVGGVGGVGGVHGEAGKQGSAGDCAAMVLCAGHVPSAVCRKGAGALGGREALCRQLPSQAAPCASLSLPAEQSFKTWEDSHRHRAKAALKGYATAGAELAQYGWQRISRYMSSDQEVGRPRGRAWRGKVGLLLALPLCTRTPAA